MLLKNRWSKFFRASSVAAASAVWSLAIAASLLLPSQGLAQDLSESQWKRGYHGFDVIVQGLGLTHVTYEEFTSQRRMDESLLVILGTNGSGAGKVRLNVMRDAYLRFYLERGGAVLIASDTNFYLRSQKIRFRQFTPIFESGDTFNGFNECPLVTNLQLPFLSGVREVVTNGIGAIQQDVNCPWEVVGQTPKGRITSRGLALNFTFAVGGELANGAKLIGLADPSVFSNQMLPFGDNGLLAKSTLEFLKGADRKNVLILVDGEVMDPVNITDLDVKLPQPSPEEVVEAIKDLPPSAMLEFANTVLNVVEDENMVNQFVNEQIDNIPPPIVNRFLIFCGFAMACLVAIATYIFQKKLKRTTASDIAYQKAEWNKKQSKKISSTYAGKSKLCFERQMAVLAMLDEFCLKHVERRFNDLKSFPGEFKIRNDELGRAIKRAMKTIHDDFKGKPRDFWTTKRLLEVEGAIAHWDHYFAKT